MKTMLALGLIFVLAYSARSAAGDPPTVPFAGNLSIAQDIIHGDAHLVVLGDSLQNGEYQEYMLHWHPDKVTGQVLTPNLGTPNPQGYWCWPYDTHAWAQADFCNTNAAPALDGYTGISQGNTQHVEFLPGTTDAEANLATNRFYMFTLDQSNTWAAGPWLYGTSKTLNLDLMLYANPQGQSNGMKMSVSTTDTPPALATVDINTYAAVPQLIKVSTSLQVPELNPGNVVSLTFAMDGGVAITSPTNFITAGVRVSTGEPGFQLATISLGGTGVANYLNPARVSDANLASFLSDTDTNIAYIWLGQNDQATYDGTAWKVAMESLLARYRQARPGIRFVLVASYDTGGARLGDYAQDLYQISQESSDVLFLNLYGEAGNFDYLSANYLADGVHENDAGLPYFADLTWGLIEQAAAQSAPEPASLLLLAAGALALWRRPGRRGR